MAVSSKRVSIEFGRYMLQSPTLFASYRLGDCPTAGLCFEPWEITATEALLVNAYDFRRPKFKSLLENDWDIQSYLSVNNKPILIDSGAYYFRKHPKINITASEILDIQIRSGADIGVVLDHPFSPKAKNKADRIYTTIKNTEQMYNALQKRTETIQLMPVVHGHTQQMVTACLRRIKQISEKYGHVDIARIGIGSIAPLAQSGQISLVATIIKTVRDLLPNSHLHCFSMGSALLMLIAFYCGADTVDSQTWIVSAGFKLAQLPGHYVIRMASREYRSDEDFRTAMNLFGARLKRLADEEGYYIKDWRTGEILDITSATTLKQYVYSLVDLVKNENVHNRACHNLWTYNFEVRKAREAISQDRFDDFITSRLSGTRYSEALEHAKHGNA